MVEHLAENGEKYRPPLLAPTGSFAPSGASPLGDPSSRLAGRNKHYLAGPSAEFVRHLIRIVGTAHLSRCSRSGGLSCYRAV
jgi:hypothetical protein